MKIVLMVAAGVAVGVITAVAVLIQVLLQLLPLLAAAAVVLIVLRLLQRRGPGRGGVGLVEALPSAAHRSAPVIDVPVLPVALPAADGPYLMWGPPTEVDLDAPPAAALHGGSHVLRTRPVGRRPDRHRRP